MKIRGLYQKRGWWYFQPATVGGKRPPAIALKTRAEDEAINLAFELFQGKCLGAQSRDSMQSMLDRYLAEMLASKGHTPKTSHCTRVTLEALVKHWGDPPVATITKEMILSWRAALGERKGLVDDKMSEASIGSYLRRLRGFLSWLVRNKQIRDHPMRDIKLGRVKKTRREKFLTVGEREILLAGATNEEIAFILHFGFFAGLRFEEMLAMEASWITEGANHQVLNIERTSHWQPKDKEARVVVLHPRVSAFLKDYGLRKPFMLRPDRRVWKEAPNYRYNPKKAFKAYVASKGLPWVSYHTLRHSFATHMAMAGAPMVEIAAALGDGVKVVEETYVAYSPGKARTITTI